MKLLTENILTDEGNFNGCRAYSEYIGYFKHTTDNYNMLLIRIHFSNNYNSEDLTISLFIKERGFVTIASFNSIAGLLPMPSHSYRSDKFVEGMQYNITLIEEWLNIVFD